MEQKKVNSPLGYDVPKNRGISVRAAQIQQGKTKSLRVPDSFKIQIGPIIDKVEEWKVNGKPLEGVAIIKALDGIKKDAVIKGVNNKKKVEEDKETEI